MAKASSAEQLRLLDLQALDSRMKQLDSRARSVRENPDLTALAGKAAAARTALGAAATQSADIERELARAEADVASVVARLERDQKHLDSGHGGSKELTALQSEIESLSRRRSDLEDTELEVMERLEAVKAVEAERRTEAAAAETELTDLEGRRDTELAEIEAERAEIMRQRTELAGRFAPDLLAVYERTLSRHGIGAARLFHGTSEGSGMQLSPGDLADIRKAAADDIVFCPDSGCILVRSSEWGS
ncbi:zinc ribbon domain-containing protein [Arthrobacter caoxuetaonis]|uniref:C4-type zinc ribbon domain-containing protein n=1 Tax=Arthrobacter caoxuetaonis TaxID=2886935 RepID=A0A9X1MCU4_9MICC|nr:C4-type zinc ribbon domain-containing protein [Arthrobacter caoxuetaonis]MCC3282541.1 C4-type zinc ribbon domain-containing protein [Arthrobacter caoxuetaonis]MCC3297678.1 C4-type zinc ribbon domain-containing protein [Arthrobacter caoxuetaonis]USQ56118.1 C4-type zinc ribbon domain-containing protein [Arthrobacter caoxuetaonis]